MTNKESPASAPEVRRGRRRKARDSGAAKQALAQLPWDQPRYLDPPVEPVGLEGAQRIHEAAMQILEEIGIDFLHEKARDVLAVAGCKITDSSPTVRMDRDFVMEQVNKAPDHVSLTPRNQDRRLVFGEDLAAFGLVASPPNVSDLDHGRRVGNRKDYQNFLRLAQSFDCIHFTGGYPVEPIDIHPSIRHLDCLFDLLTMTDKLVHAYSLGVERVEDAMEMVRIAGGFSHSEF